MSITIRQVLDAYRFVKAAQVAAVHRPGPPRRKRRAAPEAFPDYGKSLVTQMEADPTLAGLRRAGYTAPLGAILGGLIGYLLKHDEWGTALGAGAGALAGGIPGYLSGAREAESEKTRLLALRRLGINTPGELSAIQNFPESFERLTQKESAALVKRAVPVPPAASSRFLDPAILKQMGLAAAIGAPLGGLFGKYVTPQIFQYKGDPAAENMSTLIDAGILAGLAAMTRHPTAYSRILSSPWGIPGLVGAVGTSELIPVGLSTLRQTSAGLSKPTASEKLEKLVQSPTAKGLGVGAAGAGLAGLTTGLLRAPTEAEQAGGAGRPQMAAKDMLKFLIPALIAGGVGGKLIERRQPAATGPQVAAL